jgi:hypothetical protein
VLLVTAGSRGASDVNLFGQLGARQTSSSSMLVGELDAEQRPHQPRFAFGTGVQSDGGRDQIDFAGPFGHSQLVIGSASSDEVLFNSTARSAISPLASSWPSCGRVLPVPAGLGSVRIDNDPKALVRECRKAGRGALVALLLVGAVVLAMISDA